MCTEMEQDYTGNNCTRHLGQTYLLSKPDEINILAYAMKNMAYATLTISSIVIATTKVLMKCVSPLLIYPF